MATIRDVRDALKEAYDKLDRCEPGWGGKSSEAWCSVSYPSRFSDNDFYEPCALTVYSYALGPSREHYFNRAEKDGHPNYYTWESPDIFAKAVEVIRGWASEIREDGA